MNGTRLFFAIIAGFIFVFASNYAVHALWLAPDYKATAALWRPEIEMRVRFLWMLGAQLLCAIAIMYIWAKTGWRRRSIADGATYGIWMGLFQQLTTVVLYVVAPLPGTIAAKWFLAGVAQTMFLGMLAALIYKPLSATSERKG